MTEVDDMVDSNVGLEGIDEVGDEVGSWSSYLALAVDIPLVDSLYRNFVDEGLVVHSLGPQRLRHLLRK